MMEQESAPSTQKKRWCVSSRAPPLGPDLEGKLLIIWDGSPISTVEGP
jgi:hypothetical protein